MYVYIVLIRLNNKNVSEAIMGNITASLNNTLFQYGAVSILNGTQEAGSGWVAVNYLWNNLTAFNVRVCGGEGVYDRVLELTGS